MEDETNRAKNGADQMGNAANQADKMDIANKMEHQTNRAKNGADKIGGATNKMENETNKMENEANKMKNATNKIKSGADKMGDSMYKMEKGTHGSGRVRMARAVFHGLAWILVACIVIQTSLAGIAVFTDPAKWIQHQAFVHFFEFVPILMIIFAFVGRLSKKLRWQSFGLFLLIYSQYMTAHVPGAGAIHPVIALVLFGFSLHVARQAWRLGREGARGE